MSTGIRYKFQGTSIQVTTGFTADSPPQAITAVTKANPAVVTSAAHGFTDGDIISINGVVGMEELNGGSFVVLNVTTNTLELADTNSSGYGTYTSGGSISAAAMSEFCELTSYNRSGGTSPVIPATSLCSTAQEFETGLPDFGTTQAGYNFAPNTSAIQQALHAAYMAGDIIAVKVTLPKSGGSMILFGSVQQESEQAAVGGLWTGSTTIKNSGNRIDIAA